MIPIIFLYYKIAFLDHKMNTYCKPVIVLLIWSFLFLPIVSTTIYASSNNEEWETGYAVGKRSSIDKFLFLDPPRPDQIFKIHYRVINGTVEKFNVVHDFDKDSRIFGNLLFQVDSSNDAILEIKVPKNYPSAIDATEFGEPIAYESISSVELEYKIDVTDCFYVFSVPLNGDSKIELIWVFPPPLSPRNDVPASCIPETVVEDVPVRKDGTISPLHQFRGGVAAEDIVCKEGFKLVIRPDGKPYCVTLSTAKELTKRWD